MFVKIGSLATRSIYGIPMLMRIPSLTRRTNNKKTLRHLLHTPHFSFPNSTSRPLPFPISRSFFSHGGIGHAARTKTLTFPVLSTAVPPSLSTTAESVKTKNIKREFVRAQEEVKRIQSVLIAISTEMSGPYIQNYQSAGNQSPQIRNNTDLESHQYLTELLAEHQKLVPFLQVLPICSRLLNQEIRRVSGVLQNQGYRDFDRHLYRSPSPMSSPNLFPSVIGNGLGSRVGPFQERPGIPHGMSMDWHGSPASPTSFNVKKIVRLEIPVDAYPKFNFVGRLLGPRGNSLKRVEATTGCRVYIRGKGSIKDPTQEDKLRGRPGYEHLSDALHILIEADLPVNIVDVRLRQAQEIIEELLKPVDESTDVYKRQQLRELAMLNSSGREDSPLPSGNVSPFNSNGMKRAKIGI